MPLQSLKYIPGQNRAEDEAVQNLIYRMAPGNITLSSISVSGVTVNVEGTSTNVGSIEEFLRALDKRIGVPKLHFVKKSTNGGANFMISLSSFDRYTQSIAAN